MLVLWKGCAARCRQILVHRCRRSHTARTWRRPADQGWITGYADGSFKPYATLTRQQMAIIMVRAMGWDAEARKLSAVAGRRDLCRLLRSTADRGRGPSLCGLGRLPGAVRGDATAVSAPATASPGRSSAWWFCGPSCSTLAVIKQVRFANDYPDKTRVVIDLSRRAGRGHGRHLGGWRRSPSTTPAEPSPVRSPRRSARLEVASVGATPAQIRPRTVRITLALARYGLSG